MLASRLEFKPGTLSNAPHHVNESLPWRGQLRLHLVGGLAIHGVQHTERSANLLYVCSSPPTAV